MTCAYKTFSSVNKDGQRCQEEHCHVFLKCERYGGIIQNQNVVVSSVCNIWYEFQ